ncbi:MAG: glycosyltransferase family 39 protein, partial [Halobacteriota archaeon]
MRVVDTIKSKYGLALFAIILIGLFLRLYQVGTQSIWLDEAFSIMLSKMSLSQIVQAAVGDTHPPLYYFILHYWVALFGTSAVAVRLLSVLFGVLAIPMIYLVGRQLFNKEVGLIATLILALSSFNIWYSQDARMYSLMVLLALLSMYFFLRFLQRDSLALSAGYVLSTVLLVYTHSYSWFVVVAQNICVLSLMLLPRNRTFRLRRWVVLQATVLALFLPWIPVLINQKSQNAWIFTIASTPPLQLISTFYSYSGTAVLSVLFVGLSVLSLLAYQKARGSPDWKAPLKALQGYSWKLRRQDVAPVCFLVVWLLTIAAIPFILARFSSVLPYLARYTIAASVALYLLVAKGIRNINYRPVKFAVIAVIVVLS